MRPALRGGIEFAETVRRITDGGPAQLVACGGRRTRSIDILHREHHRHDRFEGILS